MPRIQGQRERQPFNVWDHMTVGGPSPGFAGDHRGPFRTKLFGPRNIADTEKCNLQIPMTLVTGDLTCVITNWYARMAEHEHQDLRELATSRMIATLVVGEKSMRQAPVSELLQRKPGDGALGGDRWERIETVARMAYAAYHDHQPHGMPVRIGSSTAKTFADIDDVERRKWEAVADVTVRQFAVKPVVIVPVRQRVYVLVEETAGESIPLTFPDLWIHIEGMATRDVC